MTEGSAVREEAWGTVQTGDERWPRENPEGLPSLRKGGGGVDEERQAEVNGAARKLGRGVPISTLGSSREGHNAGEWVCVSQVLEGHECGRKKDFRAALRTASCLQDPRPQACSLFKNKKNKQKKPSFRRQSLKPFLLTV